MMKQLDTNDGTPMNSLERTPINRYHIRRP